jgi:hypothetical protein
VRVKATHVLTVMEARPLLPDQAFLTSSSARSGLRIRPWQKLITRVPPPKRGRKLRREPRCQTRDARTRGHLKVRCASMSGRRQEESSNLPRAGGLRNGSGKARD